MPHYGDTYGLVVVTPPATEPVTLAEAKDHLRVDIANDDTLIAALSVAAREMVEVSLHRQLVDATYDMTLDRFPGATAGSSSGVLFGAGGIIYLPRPPLQSVTSITYFDTAGVSTVLPTEDYLVDTASIQGRITPSVNERTWPSHEIRINAVTVRFVAGFGDAAAVPSSIKTAILLLTADMYEHREAQLETKVEDNMTVQRLLHSQKFMEIV